jgi:hypothetical protein
VAEIIAAKALRHEEIRNKIIENRCKGTKTPRIGKRDSSLSDFITKK